MASVQLSRRYRNVIRLFAFFLCLSHITIPTLKLQYLKYVNTNLLIKIMTGVNLVYSRSSGCPAFFRRWILFTRWASIAWPWSSLTTYPKLRWAGYILANASVASSKALCTQPTFWCALTLASPTSPSRGRSIPVRPHSFLMFKLILSCCAIAIYFWSFLFFFLAQVCFPTIM